MNRRGQVLVIRTTVTCAPGRVRNKAIAQAIVPRVASTRLSRSPALPRRREEADQRTIRRAGCSARTANDRVSQRAISVAPGLRSHLRQLHDPPSPQLTGAGGDLGNEPDGTPTSNNWFFGRLAKNES